MTLTQKLEAAAKFVKGRPWGVEIGKPRIYMFCKRKDARVFFDFPKHTADDLGKAVLKCSIVDNGWHAGRWYVSQKELILAQYTQQHNALTLWLAGEEEKAVELLGRKIRRVVLTKKKEKVNAESA
jgi:hypothetical protein